MYTVEEVATELGVSKVTIYSKLKKFQDEVVVKQGKKYVTEKLFNLIKEDLKVKRNENLDDIKANINGSIIVDNDDLSNLSELNQSLINTVIDQIKEKDLQLKTKDDQMKAKDEQIKNLQKLIENSQVLLKQEQDKEMKKLAMETHFEEVDKKLLELKEKLEERRKIDIEIKEKDKERFWSRIFKGKKEILN